MESYLRIGSNETLLKGFTRRSALARNITNIKAIHRGEEVDAVMPLQRYAISFYHVVQIHFLLIGRHAVE